MAGEAKSEDALVGQARQLIEQGLALQSAPDHSKLLVWDDAVNHLVADINQALASEGFHSRSLQRHLEWLIDLYQNSIAVIAEVRDDQAAKAADLHQQRWEITG
ncbi:hypothetical protein BGP77_05635 [Saccharospirillum sp. MSK14-1]|uniref:hypothetical protein n=1 Tax=Saccharospirillum sp. MSK14-1 TaxID=1897632 RepID=UPI000D3776CC|nr:hypothetical protein [Saccharospirillum sp. MSK14-1]PTY36768.1 hypothetical protein BGP77_05635 [Saccharospirillum sp. MSK14-1]